VAHPLKYRFNRGGASGVGGGSGGRGSAGGARQTSQAILPVVPCPALGGAQGDPVLPRDLGQWDATVEVGFEQTESLERVDSGLFRGLGQGD
jgi:hypothetical protein